jgi:hypothetical protein
MFGTPKDQIEWLDTPRPGGIASQQLERGGIFGQMPTPYGRPQMFQTQYNMPPSVAAQDYGLIAPDNVSALPHSIMGMGCADCTQCKSLGSCKGMGEMEIGSGFKFALGAGIALGMLYLMWLGSKNIRLS